MKKHLIGCRVPVVGRLIPKSLSSDARNDKIITRNGVVTCAARQNSAEKTNCDRSQKYAT